MIVIYQHAGKDASETYNTYNAADLIEKELSASEKKGAFDESSISQEWTDANRTDDKPAQEIDPNEKPLLATLINLDDFERVFEKSGPRKTWAYITGASNDLLTAAINKLY